MSCCWCKASGLSYFSGTVGDLLTAWLDRFLYFQQPLHDLPDLCENGREQSLFVHIGATLKETLLSFAIVVLAGLGISVLLWSCPRLAKVLEPYLVVLNSLPKSALAPLLIVWLGARQRTIIVAGMSVAIFGCSPEPVHWLRGSEPGKAEADPHSRRGQKGGASENRSSFLHPSDPCKYEGEHRPLPGGRDHRGIHRRQTGTWVPDHIWQSDIPAGMHSKTFSMFYFTHFIFHAVISSYSGVLFSFHFL